MKSQKKIAIFLLFIFLSLAIIFLNSGGFLDYSKSAINYLIAPISKPIWSATGKISRFLSFISNFKNLYLENEDLRNQNRKLLAENAYFKNYIKEKDVLEKARDIQAQNNFNWQIAGIIGMDSQNWADFIILDIGYKSGISAGMPVITENKQLVGKVVEVDNDFSRAITIFNPLLKVGVKTQDSQAFGILNGDRTKNLIMDFVAKEKSLNNGETVLTSAKDGVFPEGIVVGTIKDFQIKPENLFQTVNVKNDLDIYSMDKVLILTDFKL